MMDPYQNLGVPKTATADEIKNAYRALAKKHHPDLNPGNKAAENTFKDVNAAYEILSDADKRAKFDRGEWAEEGAGQPGPRHRQGPFYREAHEAAGGGRYGFSGMDEDLFANLFGARGRGGASGPRPGADEQYRLEISLREAVEGGSRELQLPGGKRLGVKIPPQVVAGQKLRFMGQGAPGLGGGAAGDVYVELFLAADDRFAVEGSTLLHEHAVAFDIALLGGETTVPTPEGQVRLTVPPRTSGGRRLRVPGKGLFARGGKRGDLIVRVQIAMPEVADEALAEAVRAWRERQERSES